MNSHRVVNFDTNKLTQAPNNGSSRSFTIEKETSDIEHNSIENKDEFNLMVSHQDFQYILVLSSKIKAMKKYIDGSSPMPSKNNLSYKVEANKNIKDIWENIRLKASPDGNTKIILRGTHKETDSLIDDALQILKNQLHECIQSIQKMANDERKPRKKAKSKESQNDAIAIKYSKKQTDVLIKWMIDNRKNPFPKAFEINQLCEKTNLSYSQIVNWTTNVRKRNLKATVEGGKKPHHFLDFLFLVENRDKKIDDVESSAKKKLMVKRKEKLREKTGKPLYTNYTLHPHQQASAQLSYSEVPHNTINFHHQYRHQHYPFLNNAHSFHSIPMSTPSMRESPYGMTYSNCYEPQFGLNYCQPSVYNTVSKSFEETNVHGNPMSYHLNSVDKQILQQSKSTTERKQRHVLSNTKPVSASHTRKNSHELQNFFEKNTDLFSYFEDSCNENETSNSDESEMSKIRELWGPPGLDSTSPLDDVDDDSIGILSVPDEVPEFLKTGDLLPTPPLTPRRGDEKYQSTDLDNLQTLFEDNIITPIGEKKTEGYPSSFSSSSQHRDCSSQGSREQMECEELRDGLNEDKNSLQCIDKILLDELGNPILENDPLFELMLDTYDSLGETIESV